MNKTTIKEVIILSTMSICIMNAIHDILVWDWNGMIPYITVHLEEWSSFETINLVLAVIIIIIGRNCLKSK